MADINLEHALEIATEAARRAGTLISKEFHRPDGVRHQGLHKADVDSEAEAVIREMLLQAFPTTHYVGEETGQRKGKRGAPTWYVDPHDGTRAFIEGWRGSAVSIALVDGDLPVLGVVFAPTAPDDGGDLIAWAEGCPLTRNGQPVSRPALHGFLARGDVVLVSQAADRATMANHELCTPARFRAVPSIAYRLALVAVGEGDVGVSLNGPTHWDCAGGHALLRAVGGDLVNQEGTPLRYAHGPRGGRWVFGGHPAVARMLATRPWGRVRETTSKPLARVADLGLLPPTPGRRTPDANLLRRAHGCLLGQLAGDALGSQVEFRSAADIARAFPDGVRVMADGGTHGTIAGQPTDDSELALVLGRTLVSRGRFDEQVVLEGYRAWRDSGPFDIGTTTRAGLDGRPNAASQANGSLMRISPLAVWAHALPSNEVAKLARADSALTHPNPICGDAVAVFAVAVAHAVRTGSSPLATWEAAFEWAKGAGVEEDVIDTLEISRLATPPDFMQNQGWVLHALQNAFYQLLHADSVAAGITDTVGRGGDTDTNAAIAGALLGAVHGRDSIPLEWRSAVLSCRAVDCRHPRPETFWPVDALELAEALVVTGPKALANVVPLSSRRSDAAKYERALTAAQDALKEVREMLFDAAVTLAMAKAWREWDANLAPGMVVTIGLDALTEADDPKVRTVAAAIREIQDAFEEIGGTIP